MEKRYQVFISSTFEDLKEERQAVLRAILELDHMPAGMELFPAADNDAWQLIRDIIDASDYYVLIIGGRYGSLDSEGLGFTEKEYDYALAQKKPVIALLHRNPDNLPRGKTDTDKKSWGLLTAFRSKVENRHTCVYWETAEELKAKVIVGMTTSIKRHPAAGWVRASDVPTEASAVEVLRLRDRIAELENQAKFSRIEPPPGSDDLLQGDDYFEINVSFRAREKKTNNVTSYTATIAPTWNEIYAAVAPTMLGEASDSELRRGIASFVAVKTQKDFNEDSDLKKGSVADVRVVSEVTDTCIVQLRALGLITESVKQRSVKDRNTYWTLTPYGDSMMVKLRALRRTPAEESESTGYKSSADSPK